MDYQINHFTIQVPDTDEKTSTDQLDMDFFLQKDSRKVILGTVRFTDGTPAPCAVVKFFKVKHPAIRNENAAELEPIGHAITDDNGQFILGPVYPGEKIVLKIMHATCMTNTSEKTSVRGTYAPENYYENYEDYDEDLDLDD